MNKKILRNFRFLNYESHLLLPIMKVFLIFLEGSETVDLIGLKFWKKSFGKFANSWTSRVRHTLGYQEKQNATNCVSDRRNYTVITRQ